MTTSFTYSAAGSLSMFLIYTHIVDSDEFN